MSDVLYIYIRFRSKLTGQVKTVVIFIEVRSDRVVRVYGIHYYMYNIYYYGVFSLDRRYLVIPINLYAA